MLLYHVLVVADICNWATFVGTYISVSRTVVADICNWGTLGGPSLSLCHILRVADICNWVICHHVGPSVTVSRAVGHLYIPATSYLNYSVCFSQSKPDGDAMVCVVSYVRGILDCQGLVGTLLHNRVCQ